MPEDTSKYDTNNHAADVWTFLHLFIAFFMGMLGITRLLAWGLILAFEIVEKYLLEGGLLPNPFKELEGPRNRIMDIFLTIMGYELGYFMFYSCEACG